MIFRVVPYRHGLDGFVPTPARDGSQAHDMLRITRDPVIRIESLRCVNRSAKVLFEPLGRLLTHIVRSKYMSTGELNPFGLPVVRLKKS